MLRTGCSFWQVEKNQCTRGIADIPRQRVPTSRRVGRQCGLGRPSTDQLRDKACRLGAWSGRSSGPLSQSWVSWLISFFRSGGHWALRFQLAASVGGLPTAAVGSEHGPLDWPAEALHATLTIWPHIVPLSSHESLADCGANLRGA